ncbi:nickel ABC transporter permease [Acrocarpospora corrugata]|uniref:Nickel ABC transporter permease n=1 Tax=Acrocarpospora corrugata TaxID=35763 RepID=A0A5M3VXH6_9ACTN|nr:ABC transporter permease [Acrocarpospora corrugata]GER99500.1 nickel ABC transporter permease [Acrocarpospora corrugata]
MKTQVAVLVTEPRPAARRRVPLLTTVGASLGLLVLLTIVIGPWLIGQDPYAIDIGNRFAGPGGAHWLGTDELGRDVASRIAYGARATALIAVGAVAIATAIAIPLGVLTGFLGGWVDLVVTRVVDLFFAIPSLLVAIGVIGLFGASVTTTVLALGLSYWPFYTRLIRSAVVGLRSRPNVDAARVLGASRLRVIRTEILTGLVPLVLVQTTVLLGFAILDEAALGFLGLGVQPPQASWGSRLAESREFILVHPELALVAGVPIVLAVFAMNLLSDSLRDRLDAKRTG